MSRRPSEAKTRPQQNERLLGAIRALLFIPVVLLLAAIVTGAWVGAFDS
jgi:heme A synthase